MRTWTIALLLLGLCLTPYARAQVHVGAGWADSIDGEGAPVAIASWVGAQRHPWEVAAGYIGGREDNDVLSGHGQFMTAAGYDFGRMALSLRHLSNGDTKGVNRGETFLLLEVGL